MCWVSVIFSSRWTEKSKTFFLWHRSIIISQIWIRTGFTAETPDPQTDLHPLAQTLSPRSIEAAETRRQALLRACDSSRCCCQTLLLFQSTKLHLLEPEWQSLIWRKELKKRSWCVGVWSLAYVPSLQTHAAHAALHAAYTPAITRYFYSERIEDEGRKRRGLAI